MSTISTLSFNSSIQCNLVILHVVRCVSLSTVVLNSRDWLGHASGDVCSWSIFCELVFLVHSQNSTLVYFVTHIRCRLDCILTNTDPTRLRHFFRGQILHKTTHTIISTYLLSTYKKSNKLKLWLCPYLKRPFGQFTAVVCSTPTTYCMQHYYHYNTTYWVEPPQSVGQY